MAEIVNLGRFGDNLLMFPEGAVGVTPAGASIFALNLEAATLFFQQVAIKKMDILNNGMGVYSVVNVGRNNKAKFQGLSVPKHLLQSRKDCHVWTPKGKMYFRPEEIPTCAVEYNGEQCADSFFDSCMEKLLPAGSMVNDITGTPEGAELLGQMIQNIFLGLGNSFYDLTHYANDDFADQSATGNWWATNGTETSAEWADFRDQQTSVTCLGFIPQIEAEKADGTAHFNVDIPLADVSTNTYTGTDVTALFDSCIAAAPAQFRQLVRRRQGGIGAAFLVTPSIFEAYENYLISTYNSITEGFQLIVNGAPVPGVYKYKGVPVMAMDEWEVYDNTVGIYSHRVVLTALGNMVVAHNVEPMAGGQFTGLGFVAYQRPEPSAKGKYEMYTTFRVGAAIADTNFMVNASIVLDPSGNELTYVP